MARADVVLSAGLDVTEFNKGLQAYVNGLNRMETATQKTANEISSLGDAASTGIGVAMGVAAVQGIGAATRALTGLGKEVLTTLKFFESLQFSLETTIALNMSAADSSLSMQDALTQTGDAAESYLLTLQDLAIFSPFTTEEIASGNRTLQIYGLMADEALGLTRLITDLASVGGFGAERLQRISLATGQIFAEGRLLARDALQLTQAGVPILKFIENMTGQTTGQIQKLMRKGLLPANVAFEALVDGLKDFEGAGRRVAGTAQGLVSSLEDIRSITLRDLFKGVFEGIRPFMQELVDLTSAQEFRAAITAIGDVLGASLQQGIANVAKSIGDFIKLIRALPPETVQVIAAFGAAVAVLTSFGAAIGLVQLAIGLLINPFTVVVGVFAGFVAIFVAGQAKIAQGSQDMTKVLVDNLTKMYKIFGIVGDAPVDAIKGITTFTDAFGQASAFIIRAFDAVASAAIDATGVIVDLLSTVADWGLNVGELFASGIEAASGAVGASLGVIGSVVSGLLAPGSPPKLLPEIDTWGRLAAEEWLKGWTEADFDILGDITKSVRQELRALVSTKGLDEVSAARILIGSRQDIADAVNEITSIGRVTQDTMNRVRNSAGPAADEVEALLDAYTAVSIATEAQARAQEELNAVTKVYDDTIEPIRKELERISELRRQGDEDVEIRNLQRIIANEAVGSHRKRQAQLKIQEILLGRQVRGLENEKEAAVDAGEAKLEAANKEAEAAALALKLTQERISAQNQQIALYGEELKALEKLERELEKLRKKLRDEFLKPFEDAIKKAQLLAQEVKDTIALFKAQYTINSGNATEAEKIAAAIQLQSIEARRAKRFFELRELGVPQEEIDRLREFAVTLADIGIKTDPEFGDVDLSGIAEDVTDRITEFNEQVLAFKETMKDARKEFNLWLDDMNDLLPPFLKFRDAAGNAGPLFDNLKAAFAGIVTIIAGTRFIAVLRALPGLIFGVGTPFGLIINALGLFTAAWVGDWGNIRKHTTDALEFIQQTYTDFITKGGFNQLIPDDKAFTDKLQTIEVAWLQFSGVFQNAFSEGLSLDSISGVLSALGDAIRTTINTLFTEDLFGGIREQVEMFIAFISSPTLLAAAFNELYTKMREGLKTAFTQLLEDPTAETSMAEYIGRAVLGAAGAFIVNIPVWIGQFLGAVSDFLQAIRPSLGQMFEDFFGRVLPALLFLLGRTAGAIGSGLAELIITGLDILFTQALPILVRNMPRILGALAAGFAAGVQEAGNSIESALILLVGSITAFIATTLGPAIFSSLKTVFSRAFGLAGKQAVKDIGKIIGSIKLAFAGLAQITGVLLLNIGRDLVNIIGGALNILLPALSSAGTKILNFFGAPLRRVLIGTLTLFFTGLQKIAGGLLLLISPTTDWGLGILRVRVFLSDVLDVVKTLPGRLLSIGTAMKNGITAALNFAQAGFTAFFNGIQRIISAVPRMAAAFFNFGTTAVKAIDGVVKTIGTFALRGITAFQDAILLLGRGMEALVSRFVSVGKRLPAIATGFKNLVTGIKGFVTGFSISGFGVQIQNVATQLDRLGSRGVRAFGTAFSRLGPTIAGALARVQPLLTSFFTNLRSLASTNIIRSIGTQFANLGKGALGALQKVVPRLSQLTAGANALSPGGGPGGLAQRAVAGLGNIFKGGASGATKGITAVFETIGKSNVFKAVTSLKNLGNVLKGLKTIFLGFLSPLTLVTTAIDFFAFAFGAEIDGVENRAQNFIGTLRQIWDDLISGQLWQDIINTARTWIATFLDVISLISEFGFDSEEVQTRLAEIGQGMLDWVSDLGARIWESITEFWVPVFFQWIAETITNLVETLGTISATIIEWIGTAAGWLGEKIKEWVGVFTEWWNEGGGQEKTVETLTAILTQIGDWIVTAAEWLAGKLAIWIPAFIQWIIDVVPPLLVALGGFLLAIGAWLIEQAPVVANKLLEWGAAFLDWLGPVTVQVIGGLGDWLAAIITWIVGTAIPGIIKGAVGLIIALVGWISGGGEDSAEKQAPTKLEEFLTSLKEFFTQHLLPALFDLGKKLVLALWEGFKQLWDELGGNDLLIAIQDWIDGITGTIDEWITAGKTLIAEMVYGMTLTILESVDTIKDKVVEILTAIGAPDFIVQWVEKGALLAKEFIFGIADGIVQWAFHPIEKLKETLGNLGQAAKEFLGISSPSKLFAREIGVPIAEGVAEGIQSVDQDEAVSDLETNIVNSMASINTAAVKQIKTMSDDIQKLLKDMKRLTGQTVEESRDDILEVWTELKEDTILVMIELEEFLVDLFDRTTEAMLEDLGTMYTDVTKVFGDIRSDIEIDMAAVRSKVITEFTTMNTESVKQAGLMATGVLDALIYDENSMLRVLERVLIGDSTTGESGAGAGIGEAFMLGIAQGFTSLTSYNALVTGLKSTIDSALNEIARYYDIGSPSEVAAKMIGEPIIQGIILGMVRTAPEFTKVVDALVLKEHARLQAAQQAAQLVSPQPQRTGFDSDVGVQRIQNYNLNVSSANAESAGIIRDFATMEALS